MRLKTLIGAAAIAVAGAFASALPANAVTVNDNGLTEGGMVSNSISPGDIFQIEIFGNASDGGGSIVWKFTATKALIAIETNSLNPVSGFASAKVEWNSQADGMGVSFGSISAMDLIMGEALTASFAENEMKFLIASWSDVTANMSNFDLRIEAAAIPLPASVLMLLGALGGLGLLSRRREVA